jgi:hypothetical protein
LRGDAPKTKSAAETIVKPTYSRVCQPPFSYLKARTEGSVGYAGAERILNPLVGAAAERTLNPLAGVEWTLNPLAGAERILNPLVGPT